METDLSISRTIASAQELLQREEAATDLPTREGHFPFNTYTRWGDLNRHNSPYSFSLNFQRYGELLEGVFGLTPLEMKRIDIHIVGEGRINFLTRQMRERVLPGGKKRVIGREITIGLTGIYDDESAPPSPWGKRPIDASIYLFTFWHFFVIERKMILKYVKKQTEKIRQKLLGKHMRVFSVTDEMLNFLASSPDQADERLRKLAGIKLREEILGITAHEVASHFFDTTKGTVDKDQEMRKRLRARLLGQEYTPPNIMGKFRQSPVVRRFLPNIPQRRPDNLIFEDLAQAVGKAIVADPKFRDLIEFDINPDWPFKNGKSKFVNDHEVCDVAGEAAGLNSTA